MCNLKKIWLCWNCSIIKYWWWTYNYKDKYYICTYCYNLTVIISLLRWNNSTKVVVGVEKDERNLISLSLLISSLFPSSFSHFSLHRVFSIPQYPLLLKKKVYVPLYFAYYNSLVLYQIKIYSRFKILSQVIYLMLIIKFIIIILLF